MAATTRPIKIPIAKPVPVKPIKLKITPVAAHRAAPKIPRVERMARAFGGMIAEKKPGRFGKY